MRLDPSSSISRRAGCGRAHDVGQLRLDAEIDATVFGQRNSLAHFLQQIAPGLGAGIVGMMPPLVVRIARARAQRHQPRAHARRRANDRGKPGQPVGALRRIGMDHVVGAGDRGNRHARRAARLGDLVGSGRRDRIGHGGAAETGHVELRHVVAGVA